MARVADLLVSRLRSAGVRTLFGVPGGGSNLDVIEAAGRCGLPFVLTSTETAGALAAMAQTEITGAPGACLTTLGPGVTSVMNGVACAFLDRAPVVVLTDAHPAPAGFNHQRVDHNALMRPITKWSRRLTSEGAADVVDRALALAMERPPGPVHLDCAWQAPDVGERSPDQVITSTRATIRVSEFDAIVSRARKPLLIIGLGARTRPDAEAIRAFCSRRTVPAMVTYKAKGVVPDDAPAFAGVFTNGAIERSVAEEADLLIGVGLDPVELIPRAWDFAAPVVYCGPGPMCEGQITFGDHCFGDVQNALARVDAQLQGSNWDVGEVARKTRAARERVRAAGSDRLTPDRVVDVAAERLATSHRVTVDAGAHMFAATMLWPVRQPNDMLISNGLSTMGFALPAAIGAALADRERPVVALTGDGGLLMCAGELLTAARERLRIMTIVFSDASLSLIEIKQQARRLRPDGVALGSVAWPQLAESLGITAFATNTEHELARAVESAVAVDGPTLIEAKIDRTSYAATLRAIRG